MTMEQGTDNKLSAYRIGQAEYEERHAKLQRLMQERGYEMLFVYGDDHSFAGAGHVRYFSGYAPHFEPVLIVFPAQGGPLFVTGPECRDYALTQSAIAQLEAVNEFALPGQEYPFADLYDLVRLVEKQAGRQAQAFSQIGIVGLGDMPHYIYQAISDNFPQATISDATALSMEIRRVKSPAEIAIIRRAYEIADAGMQACINAIRPGVSEFEVAAEGEYAMRKMGAEGTAIDTIVGSGPNSRPIIVRSTGRIIRPNELTVVSIGPRFMGYHAALGRPVWTGDKLPPELDKAVRVSNEAMELTRELLRPGQIGEKIEAAGRKHVKDNGLGDYYVYSSCHSVGTVEAEEPILGPGCKLVVAEDMAFNIDIPLFLAPFGGFRSEDGFLVTPGGAERLNKTPAGPFFRP